MSQCWVSLRAFQRLVRLHDDPHRVELGLLVSKKLYPDLMMSLYMPLLHCALLFLVKLGYIALKTRDSCCKVVYRTASLPLYSHTAPVLYMFLITWGPYIQCTVLYTLYFSIYLCSESKILYMISVRCSNQTLSALRSIKFQSDLIYSNLISAVPDVTDLRTAATLQARSLGPPFESLRNSPKASLSTFYYKKYLTTI